jgi:hypothetical protein
MVTLIALTDTDVGALGSRVLLTGSVYGVGVSDYGTIQPLTRATEPLVSQRIDLVDAWSDFTPVTSGANRTLLTGAVYGADCAPGFLRPLLLGLIEGADFGAWGADFTSAIAWPLIDFHIHTHVIDDWGADAVATLEWDPLEDAPWEFSVDALSSLAWYLTTGAAWNTDMRCSVAWELSTSHKITDWTAGGAATVEWEPLHFDGIGDWTIDIASSLRWVTWGNLKDGICIIATVDQVGVPAPLGGGVGTPRNMVF